MNILLTIIISILVCIAYDLIKTKIIKIKFENLKDDELFSMFDDYFKD